MMSRKKRVEAHICLSCGSIRWVVTSNSYIGLEKCREMIGVWKAVLT